MTIDFTKLLGFATVSQELSAGIDLQNDTLGSKLGAKVGDQIESQGPARVVNFQNDAFASRLGAKMGPGEPTDPCGH
jgi:hypothetical protein